MPKRDYIEVLHVKSDEDIDTSVIFGLDDEKEVLRLKTWLSQVLSLFGNEQGQTILDLVNAVVYEHGFDQGWEDARTHDEHQYTLAIVDPVWADGYTVGWVERKGEG